MLKKAWTTGDCICPGEGLLHMSRGGWTEIVQRGSVDRFIAYIYGVVWTVLRSKKAAGQQGISFISSWPKGHGKRFCAIKRSLQKLCTVNR